MKEPKMSEFSSFGDYVEARRKYLANLQEEAPKKIKKVAMAYPAFRSSFQEFIPNLSVISDTSDIRNIDLLIVSGGGDVNPRTYGENNIYSNGISDERDSIEINAIRYAFERKIKIFGACRGHQIIAVALGGRLIQDIKLQDFDGKEKNAYHPGTHNLEWRDSYKTNPVYQIFAGKDVVSCHHQGVISTPLTNVAWYNGLSELSVYENRVISTQFHPEFDNRPHIYEFFKFLVETW